jgi:AcrR family transcriptional regulator
MAASTPMGLRERKKLRTRETIVDVSMRLFAAQGYDETTVVQIADAAEVSPSTFFTYFPTKEEVVFDRYDEGVAGLVSEIGNRPAAQTTIDAFDAFIRPKIVEFQEVSELGVLRYRVIQEHPDLRKALRHRFSDIMETALRAGYARDLNTDVDAIEPQLLAGATVGAFTRFEAAKMAGIEAGTASLEEQLAMFDALITSLRASLDALAQDQRSR